MMKRPKPGGITHIVGLPGHLLGISSLLFQIALNLVSLSFSCFQATVHLPYHRFSISSYFIVTVQDTCNTDSS